MADKEFIQKNADRLIFALDTGTRSVVGVLGLWENDLFCVVDYEQCPHKTRAMKDGQIEDIGQVVQAIQTVKTALEQRWDITLTRVSIAAAGRALKTVSAEFAQEIPAEASITPEQIRSIEYGAVSAALDTFCQREENAVHSPDRNAVENAAAPLQRNIGHPDDIPGRNAENGSFDNLGSNARNEGFDTLKSDARHGSFDNLGSDAENQVSLSPGDFSCVGYSVSGYWLDDYPISNLEGHRGKRIKTGIIAAFLPQTVVRSLYAATDQCGLQVVSLTLEPVAAIQAIVPGDLRLLNLAIVDIGAGTSDIAVTQNGSVIAYDMVTLAGDEITETFMRHCLTDFDTAEQIKLSLCREPAQQSIPFTDILGNACFMDVQEAMETVEPAVKALCQAITRCILRINGASPAAVFLIGGGSQLDGLTSRIAQDLGLPENRVALGGVRPYPHIQVCSQQLLSPEFVTPLGIGVISTLVQANDYLSVQINQQKVMIPGTGSLKIVDALLLAGIRSSSLMGRTPPSLVFYKNNQPQTFRSAPSTPGELYRNGIPATLNTQIRQGDEITLIPAKDGASPQIFLRDICDFGENVICTVNGLPGAPDYLICPQDDIRIFSPEPQPEALHGEERNGHNLPGTFRSEAVQPEALRAEASQFKDSQSQASHFKTSQFESFQSETVQADASQPETSHFGASQSEAVQPEALRFKTSRSESFQSETVQADASQSEAFQFEASQFKAVQPEAVQPEAVQSEAFHSEADPVHGFQTEVSSIDPFQTESDQPATLQMEAAQLVETSKLYAEDFQSMEASRPLTEKSRLRASQPVEASQSPTEFQPGDPSQLTEESQTEASQPSAEEFQSKAHSNPWTGELRIQLNGRWVAISRPSTGSLYFVDLLNYVDIDPKKPNGAPVLLLNGREASYLDPVVDGDQVEIRWSKEKGFLSQNN